MRSFILRVPATSANIGPGFDVVGLALSLYLQLTVTIPSESLLPYSPPTLTYSGEGAADVPLDPYKNLTTRVALYVLRCHNIPQFPSHITIHVHNEIPFSRGLGSSGAAVIAGILLGNELGACGLSTERILDFALMVERHPDNVTAALVGGFVGSYLRELDGEAAEAASVPLSEVLPEYPPDAGAEWGLHPPLPPTGIGHYIKFAWAPSIKALAIIPRFELSTATARQVLPLHYSRKDLVSFKSPSGSNSLSLLGIQFTTHRPVDNRTRPVTSRSGPHLRGNERPSTSAVPQCSRKFRLYYDSFRLTMLLDPWLTRSDIIHIPFHPPWSFGHMLVWCRSYRLGTRNRGV
jgi:homoserine kinase